MIEIKQCKVATYQDNEVIHYSLTNLNSGFNVVIQNYGGIIVAINTPDRDGKFANVVVSSSEFDPSNSGHLGAITGRVAGRIRHGKFSLNNQQYQLELNNGTNHIHGGSKSLNKKFWQVNEIENGIELSYFSPDGEEGYPANLMIKIAYQIIDQFSLKLTSSTISDQETIVNLTNHSYFDLTAGGEAMNMCLKIPADFYAPIDATGCVIGELATVENSVFDFRQSKPLIQDLTCNDQQLLLAGGYDHPFVLDTTQTISLTDQQSGRVLMVTTDEPCCVVYTSNNLKPKPHRAVCLETQKMPNAINWPEFSKSVIHQANQEYISQTIWKFGVI
ncbi:MAG: hypothetical protein RLZZ293_1065 [Pseudomonadota bacterium]|jgi:aldose 1-epimerase